MRARHLEGFTIQQCYQDVISLQGHRKVSNIGGETVQSTKGMSGALLLTFQNMGGWTHAPVPPGSYVPEVYLLLADDLHHGCQ